MAGLLWAQSQIAVDGLRPGLTVSPTGLAIPASLGVPTPILSSAALPNEPAGYAAIFSQPFDAKPPNLNSRDAFNWGFDRDAAQTAIVTDATALRSPGNVIDGIFDPAWFTANTGGAGGSAPFRLEGGFFGNSFGNLYQAVWLKHSSNFTDSGNFATKVSYLRDGGQTNHWWGFESASGTDEFYFVFEFQGGTAGQPSGGTIRTSVLQGSGTSIFQAKPLGVWRRYEILVLANTPGVQNGTLKVWADGLLIINYNNCGFFATGNTPAWTGVAWEPVYGGGSNPPAHVMDMYIDHWYASHG